MSDNPFQSAAAYGAKPSGPPSTVKPTGVTVFSILCLILGILGLAGVCFQGVGLAFVEAAKGVIEQAPTSPQMTEEQKAIQLKALELATESIGIQIGIMVLSFFVAVFLIVGSFAALTGKTANLLKMATLVAAIFVLLRLAINVVLIQLPTIAKLKEMPGFDSTQQMSQNIGLIVAVVIALAFAGFYCWTHLYLRGDKVTRYFAGR